MQKPCVCYDIPKLAGSTYITLLFCLFDTMMVTLKLTYLEASRHSTRIHVIALSPYIGDLVVTHVYSYDLFVNNGEHKCRRDSY